MRDRLLVRHFLRRLVENDLLSPDADRHEVLGIACASLITGSIAVTVLISNRYQFSPLQQPGWTTVAALDDRFLFVGVSMVVMALVAVAQWDALSLDLRDGAILGPLPLPHRMLVRAKLAAIALFALVFALALNVIPSLIYPVLLTSRLPISLGGVVELIPTHLVVTAASGAFGFLSIVAIRELLRAVTGESGFARISTFVQGLLLVGLATAFLLLPRAATNVLQRWPAGLDRAVPPMWFVALHEHLAGDVVDRLARVYPPPEAPNYDGIVQYELHQTRTYRSHRAELDGLAPNALSALGLVTLAAFGFAAWNGRRLPSMASAPSRSHGFIARGCQQAGALLVRSGGAARAGYFFALQTLGRSAPHRASLAVAAALSLAIAVLSAGSGAATSAATGEVPLTALAIQPMVLLIFVIAIRHAAALPADPRAGWIFRIAWAGRERDYLRGVKLASLLSVLAAAILLLLPVHALALGWSVAARHALVGLVLAVLVVEAAFFKHAKVPFVCAYETGANYLGWSPVYLVAFLVSTYTMAWLERLAFEDSWSTITLVAVLAAGAVALHLADRSSTVAVYWDDSPAPATQRLTLSE
jgi:hypothetical protein